MKDQNQSEVAKHQPALITDDENRLASERAPKTPKGKALTRVLLIIGLRKRTTNNQPPSSDNKE